MLCLRAGCSPGLRIHPLLCCSRFGWLCQALSGPDLCPCFGCALGLLALPLLLCCAFFCFASLVPCVPPCQCSGCPLAALCLGCALGVSCLALPPSLFCLLLWFRLAFSASCLLGLCSAVPVLCFCPGCSPGLRFGSALDCSFLVWPCQALSGHDLCPSFTCSVALSCLSRACAALCRCSACALVASCQQGLCCAGPVLCLRPGFSPGLRFASVPYCLGSG